MDGYHFKSSLFDIEPGEDEETNPRIYGRQLALWLKTRLEQRGYDIEPVIAEDWGRCLMCYRDPFLLWVGCANMVDYDTAQPGDPPPDRESIIWHCFVAAEVPILKRLFSRPDTAPSLDKLHAELHAILASEPDIRLVPPP